MIDCSIPFSLFVNNSWAFLIYLGFEWEFFILLWAILLTCIINYCRVVHSGFSEMFGLVNIRVNRALFFDHGRWLASETSNSLSFPLKVFLFLHLDFFLEVFDLFLAVCFTFLHVRYECFYRPWSMVCSYLWLESALPIFLFFFHIRLI